MVYRVHPGQLSSRADFREQVLKVWDEFEFAPDSEAERVRREQPIWG
jgi:hypothetical protein